MDRRCVDRRLHTWIYPVLLLILVFVGATASTDSVLRRPEQIHVGFGNSLDQMLVMWSTNEDVASWVEYGETVGFYHDQVKSSSVELGVYSWNSLRFIHRANLTKLKTGTRYFYRVVSQDRGQKAVSAIYSFRTLTEGQNHKSSFLVYGDMGKDGGVPTFPVLEKEIKTQKYDAIWHVGDLAYDLHEDGGQVGDEFMRRVQNITANIPYMVAPGNHEISGDFAHYRTRFSTPNTPWPIPISQMWYSYDIGLVHFVSFSTEVYFTYNQNFVCQQFDWLKRDLMRANRNRHLRPWIIALGHRPMYCSNSDWDDCTDRIFAGWVKRGLEDLFYAQGVDLIIEAHEHSYERMWPVYKGQVTATNYNNPKAPVHVISGGAGCRELNDPMKYNAKHWSAYRHSIAGDNTYGHLEVHNRTHLYWDQVRVKNGEKIDSMWVVQTNHGSFLKGVDCTRSGAGCDASLTCPTPFRYETLLVCLGVLIGLAVVGCAGACSYRKYRKRKTRYAHTLLLQADDEDEMDNDYDIYPHV